MGNLRLEIDWAYNLRKIFVSAIFSVQMIILGR